MTEALRWMRDWALLGGITCAIAPGVADRLDVAPEVFPQVAAALGAASGAALGLALRALLTRLPERAWVSFAAVWPLFLGGWGAAVAGTSAILVAPSSAELAVVCGAVAALVQTLWFAPAYVLQARRRGWRWPLLAVAVPMAVLAGVADIAAVAGLNEAFGWGALLPLQSILSLLTPGD